ncbi:MAG: SPFH domain-containing protein [Minisyncoccia bacterium]
MDLGFIGEVLGSLVGGGTTFFASFKLVNEGEQGVKLRFGKAVRYSFGPKKGNPKVFEPGLTLLIPFVDAMYTRHTRIQTLELQGQSITIANGLSYIVDAVVRFRVKNVYNALFVVDDLDLVMNNVSMTVLRNVLTPTRSAEDMSHTDQMSKKLSDGVKVHEEEWGTEIEEFSVISCVPTAESQQIVNAAAGVEMRLKVLTDAFGSKEEVLKHPQIAAALVGVPVAVAISHERVQFAPKPDAVDSAEED